jgi:tetratricopeptide (TPR) repeat protein
MSQKKKKLQRRSAPESRGLQKALVHSESLLQRGLHVEARQLLDGLIDKYPQRPEVFRQVARVAFVVRDQHLLQFACERLQMLAPHDPDVPVMLATAYVSNGWPALAVATARRGLAAHPMSHTAEESRVLVETFEPKLAELAAGNGFAGTEGLECLVMHDRVRAYLAQGKYGESHLLAEQLIARQPRFAPAYNNGAEACFHDGRLAQAIALTERVFGFEPGNVYALSNLVRFQAISGKMAEARRHGVRLKEVEATTRDWAGKQAEALTLIGDDAGVLAVVEKAGRLESGPDADSQALLHHLAAVARLHQGDERAARDQWQAALQAMPGFQPARGNLDDLKQPIGKRHAPWIGEMSLLAPKKLIAGLFARIKSAPGSDRDRATGAAAKAYVAVHPELQGMVPLLLALGDAASREFAMLLARLIEAPAVREAVRDFALSQHGPDDLRTQAAFLAEEAGLMPAGPVRLWIEGGWRPIAVQRYEIHTDPVKRTHAPGVSALIESGVAALRVGDAAGAEALLRRALAIDPDDPVVLNNLAGALAQLGRLAETEAIAVRLVERHPDYLFGRTALASMAAQRGEMARAHELLAPLLTRRRFHANEFSALCQAQINLFLAEKNVDQAQLWLDSLRRADPDHPGIKTFERILRR